MYTLVNYMVSPPLPCVYFVISDREQKEIYSLLSSVNKNRNPSKPERFSLKLMEKDYVPEQPSTQMNWFEKIMEEPTCVVYCTDWQKYKIESSKGIFAESISDPNLVDILSGSVGVPTNFGKEDKKKDKKEKKEILPLIDESDFLCEKFMRVTSKNLEKLIRRDIDEFLVQARKINSTKSIPHKFLFLITLNENIKTPNKVIGSLKSLDPSEVCAVCVTCGLDDINTKLDKLEQMIYETSVSYYEKKIKKITKTMLNLKNQITGNLTEVTELYYVLLNFKIAYFSEFTTNRKEAYAKYMICWNSLKNFDPSIGIIDKISLSFFICIRVLDYLFFNGDITNSLNVYTEFKDFWNKLIKERYTGLYYNLIYLMNYYIAHKLESNSASDEKNSKVLLQQASYYYKWTIYYLMKLRSHIVYINNRSRPKPEDEFYRLNATHYPDCENYSEEQVIEENEFSTWRKYHIPPAFDNILYYVDHDYASLYNEENYKLNEKTEEDLIVVNTEDISKLLEDENYLQKETINVIMKSFNINKGLNYPINLLSTYSVLGDSFFLSTNYRESFKIYLSTLNHILYNISFNQTYLGVVSRYSEFEAGNLIDNLKRDTDEIDYVKVINMFMYAELIYQSLYTTLLIKILSKLILSLTNLLNIGMVPTILCDLADITMSANNPNECCVKSSLGSSDAKESDEQEESKDEDDMGMYRLVFIKALITFMSIYTGECNIIKYLKYIVEHFAGIGELKDENVEGGEYMTDSEGMEIFQSEARSNLLESYVLLSKDNKSQYVFKYVNESIEIIIHFETNVKFNLFFCEGFLDTSEGLLCFNYKRSEYISETFVIYADQSLGNRSEGTNKMVCLPNNTRIMFIIQFPFYSLDIDTFKINGLVFKCLYLRTLLVNSFVLTNEYFVNKCHRNLEQVTNMGKYSGIFNYGSQLLDYNTNDVDNERILNLIYLSCNNYFSDFIYKGIAHMDKAEELKIMNLNMKMKIFVKNAVKNFMTPITIVVLCNHRFRHLYNRYRYEIHVESNDFYILGKTEEEYVIYRTNFVCFDFIESLIDFEPDLENYTIKLSDSNTQPRFILCHPTNDNIAALSEKKIDEGVLEYINMYRNNYDVYILHGLIDINSQNSTVKVDLYMDNENKPGMYKDVDLTNKDKLLLLYNRVLDVYVNNIICVNMNYKVYDNTNMLLYIDLINNTDICYVLLSVKVLYNNHRLSSNEPNKLYGYKDTIDSYQNINFIHVINNFRGYRSKRHNSIQIQITKYIKQHLSYPFNHMKHFLKYTINKSISINEPAYDNIKLILKHKSIVHLGEPFELEAEITNKLDQTVEYDISLTQEGQDKPKSYILSGPLSLSLVSLPRSSDKLIWTIIPIRTSQFNLPTIRVSNKLDSSQSASSNVDASQIYVVP